MFEETEFLLRVLTRYPSEDRRGINIEGYEHAAQKVQMQHVAQPRRIYWVRQVHDQNKNARESVAGVNNAGIPDLAQTDAVVALESISQDAYDQPSDQYSTDDA